MQTHILLLAAALLFSACSKKKENPAGAGTGATAPAVAAPTTPAPADPAAAPTDPAAAPTAPPPAPEAGPDLENAKKQASAWLSALGKRNAAALAAASLLPFEAAEVFEFPEKCLDVKTRATTAAELKNLTKCLILDRELAKDASLIDLPGVAGIEPGESDIIPDSPSANALKGTVRWIQINILGDKHRVFYLAVADKGVQYVDLIDVPGDD